jgi:hypothetical protein
MTTLRLLVFLGLWQAGNAALDAPHTGQIHGRVIDNWGVIPGFNIEVVSGDNKCDVVSNGSGEFDCELPKGRYRVVAPIGNYMPYRTATIDIPAGAHRLLIIRPVVRGPTKYGPEDPALKYKERAVPGGGGTDVLVRFQSVTRGDQSVVFRGPYLMLSVDTLAIYADEIKCAADFSTCTAVGLVSVDLNDETFEGKSLDLNLQNRRFVLTKDAQLGRTF